MSSSSTRKRSRNRDDDDESPLQSKKIRPTGNDDLNSSSSPSTLTASSCPDNDDEDMTVLDDKSFLSAGGDSPFYKHLYEPIDCDDTSPLSHALRLQTGYHKYFAIDFCSSKIHCHSVLCEGRQVPTWHKSMNDCINHLIDGGQDRVKEIDWKRFGEHFVYVIWDDEEYLEAYDRLRKTFHQRYPLYYHLYMEALPEDAHLRAIRARYSIKHLKTLSYYDIHWWKRYIIWGDVLDDMDYMKQYNIRYWLQAYQSLRLMMSKIPTTEQRVDSKGTPLIFPLAYHPLSLEYEHKLFHKPPPFVDDCIHCKYDQERYERFEVYNL